LGILYLHGLVFCPRCTYAVFLYVVAFIVTGIWGLVFDHTPTFRVE
jgi:hypothetical protein